MPISEPATLNASVTSSMMTSTNTATSKYLVQENHNLCKIVKGAGQIIEANYAQLKLMEIENAKYCEKTFSKKKQVALNANAACHLTSEETLDLLAWHELKKNVVAIIKELKPKFKSVKKHLADAEKAFQVSQRKAEREEKVAQTKVVKAAQATGHKGQHCERSRGNGGRGKGGRGRGRGGKTSADISVVSLGEAFSGLSLIASDPPSGYSQALLDGTGPMQNDEQADSLSTHPHPCPHPCPCPLPLPHHALVPTQHNSSATCDSIHGTPATDTVLSSSSVKNVEGKTVVEMIQAHKWVGRGLQFEVLWEDRDITWVKRSIVKDCAALDDHLKLHCVTNPSQLPKAKDLH
ncbi:hypothetical protein GYMLUDRAFT_63563 [Collybiopsis luxurians FD-317 M1]|uniref:Unplaced genomic scaffold GYMLUscaffold_76, whole genome shotgun sequence n=1 Tax=Collybiopsis luxurians FD-317 M1 TaxID=944289 RepID=A0A0D0ATH9_9AGAR|nr:hypothetical protein GYMLUDRAFT_63563 [Collybiopsis luxurians FD-317 M1]